MTPVEVDVCIVGGGFTGLAAACALRKSGASVVLIERRTELGDPNRGDLIPPRAVELLSQWGVDLVQRGAFEIRSLEIASGLKVIARRRFKKQPALCLPHVQLEAALRDAAKAAGVDLRFGWQLQSLLFDAGHTRVTGVTAVSGIDAGAFSAKVVIGADGRRSIVREALALRFQPRTNATELVALEAELAGGGAVSNPERVTYSIGAQGGGASTPLSRKRIRVVAVAKTGEADALARKGPAALLQELPPRSPLPLGASIDPSRVRSYEFANGGHAANYATKGAVCIGDAVHPAPPPSMEGFLMALADVEALARSLAPALKENDRAVDRALVKFETERWPDNEKRLARAEKAMSWLSPLSKGRLLLARTPAFGSMALSSLLAAD